jgi:uncharacterized protein (TIGR02678 family)
MQREPQTEASRTTEAEIAGFIENARSRYGRYWRKSAREPGSERELARIAIGRLQKLRLIVVAQDDVRAAPALTRFVVDAAEIIEAATAGQGSAT